MLLTVRWRGCRSVTRRSASGFTWRSPLGPGRRCESAAVPVHAIARARCLCSRPQGPSPPLLLRTRSPPCTQPQKDPAHKRRVFSFKHYTFYILYKRNVPEGARVRPRGPGFRPGPPRLSRRGSAALPGRGPADQGMITSFRPFRPFPVRPYLALQGQVP